MGVYTKATRQRKFLKRRPRRNPIRKGMATKRDLMLLSKQVSATREVKNAFANQTIVFGSYNADNEVVSNTYKTERLGITGGVGEIGIPLGTAQNQRIGNDIRIKKVMLRANFTVRPVDVGTNPTPIPQIVKIYFGYSKPQSAIPRQGLPFNANSFFKFGGSATSPTGTVNDLTRVINTDLYTIVKKSPNMKLGNSAYYQGNANAQDWNNNDFNMFKTYTADLTKFYIKNQKFNGSDNGSSNRGLDMYVTCVPADGSSSVQFPCEMTYELQVSYTDS